MDASGLVLVLAALVGVVGLTDPLARRLRLPLPVVLAGLGIGVGLAAAVLVHCGAVAPETPLARFFADPPVGSDVFLTVFLPLLLFNAALGMDVHQLAEDAVPVLLLAVIAVVVATLAIGAALMPVSGLPAVACLLLGCIVATTDPVAVIAIFRDVGAPERLVRLVEGESLLNDAAAITLFVVFSAVVTAGAAVDPLAMALDFLVIPLGGALVGVVLGRAAAGLIGRIGDNRLAEVSLSLALPVIAHQTAEHLFHLSGVIAVVAAGLAFAAAGPARTTPSNWRTLRAVWAQIDYIAAGLIFLLAAILIPRLIGGVGLADLGLLAVLAAAALAARYAIVFLVLPALTAAGLSPEVSRPYRTVILWGGLRGAATLALALAVTEHPDMPAEVARLTAVLATGFTLFTLLVQGLTLRPLMRRLGLDRLTPVDAALRDRAVAVARDGAAAAVADTAARHGFDPAAVAEALAAAGADAAGAGRRAEAARAAAGLGADERIALALVAVAGRERALVLAHAGEGTVGTALADRLLSDVRALTDAARTRGEAGYRAAAARTLAFSWRDALAHALHRRFGVERPLARRLEERYERLTVTRIVLDDTADFLDGEVAPVFGAATAAAVRGLLEARRTAAERAVEALRLQFPRYAAALERRFLGLHALALQIRQVDAMAENGLVNEEVHRDLARAVADGRAAARAPVALDLGLDVAALVRGTPLFAHAGEAEVRDLAAVLRPVIALPGERLIRKGEKGDAAWFISSGAVEADTGRRVRRIGRGDIFGEIALLTGSRRTADVTAIAYCALLRLSRRDLDAVLARHPALAAHLRRIADERTAQTLAEGMGG